MTKALHVSAARAALEEIVEAGRKNERQERVSLGGLLQQRKSNLSYEEIRELTGHHAERGSLPPGYSNTQASHFENRHANVENLPDLPLRFGFLGPSGSGKGVAMLDLLLRHHRGAFDRIYLYSRSASLDKGWDPLRKYVAEVQGVNQDDEKTFFDDFDAQALQEQMDLQMRVAQFAKRARRKELPQVLWIFDDLVDDPRILHSNHSQIATLAIRSRHFGGSLWVASQKWRALANIIRVNLNGVFVWPALSNRLERKAIIEKISGRFTPEEVEEMLQHVSQRPFGFLFADLTTTDPDRMFQDSFVQYLRPRE